MLFIIRLHGDCIYQIFVYLARIDPRSADSVRDIPRQRGAVQPRGQRQGGGALRALHRGARPPPRVPALPADHRARRHAVHPPQPGPRHAGGASLLHPLTKLERSNLLW